MKKIISTLLAMVMLLSAFGSINVFAASSTDFEYTELADGTAELTKYRKNEKIVAVPQEISKNIMGIGNKIKVSKIGSACFNNCTSIESIEINAAVTDINGAAFDGCTSLKKITVNNSSKFVGGSILVDTGTQKIVKVCAGAANGAKFFDSYNLNSYVFNARIIGNNAFVDNTSLEKIGIGPNLKTVEANAFKNCSKLKEALYFNDTPQALSIASGNDVFKNAKKTPHYTRSHNLSVISKTKATLTKNGKIVRRCSLCRQSFTTAIPYPKTVKLSKTSFTYNGKTRKPGVKVKGADGKVISNKSYSVSYSKGRKNVGKYAVKVKFKGNYSGTKTLSFKIVPKKTAITKLTGGKKQFTVKYKKSKGAANYQIQYATNSKFTKNKKSKFSSSLSKTISSLKAGTTYYVRVRAYKTVNGKKYYSAWSAVKSVKTKSSQTTEQKVKKLIKGHYLYLDESQAPELYEFYFSDDKHMRRNEYDIDDASFSFTDTSKDYVPWSYSSRYSYSGTYTVKGNCISYQYYDSNWSHTVKGKIYYDTKRREFKTEPMYIDAPFDDPSLMVVKELYYSKTKLPTNKMSPVYRKLQQEHPYPNPYK